MVLAAAACARGRGAPVGPQVAPPATEHLIALHLPSPPSVEGAALAHVLRAQYLLHTEHLDESIDELRLARLYDEHSPYLEERLAMAFLATDHLEDAQRILAAALGEAPDDAGLNEVAGQLALDDWRYADAARSLEKALGDAELLDSAAPAFVDALLWQGRRADALARVAALLDAHAGDADLALSLAAMLEDHVELDAALDAYRRTRAQRPSDRTAALGEMRILLLAMRPAEAADALVPLLQFYPDEPELYLLLVRLLTEAGRPGGEAYRVEALRQADGDVAAILNVAAADMLAGHEAEAEALLGPLLRAHPADSQVRLYLANLALRRGDATQCVALLTPPEASAAVWRKRADCELARHRPEAMLEALGVALELTEEPGAALADAVPLLVRGADETHARLRFERLVKRLGAQLGRADIAQARACLLEALGRADTALASLGELAAGAPDNIGLQLRLADMQARHGRLPDALALLEDLVR
ncbi:MAG TPA: hypothetical protein VFH51_04905, partial [Myxococcota bacterium]|nr:hypothetical protein [Myxococcota bacterium]